jgi:hypothetical protein
MSAACRKTISDLMKQCSRTHSVIGHGENRRPAPAEAFGSSLLDDAVLSPLASEKVRKKLTVYFGCGYAEREPFSFLRARLATSEPRLFARPDLSRTDALDLVISPHLLRASRS